MVPAIRTAAADGNRTADIAGQRIIAKMRKLGVKLPGQTRNQGTLTNGMKISGKSF
jgi:hypothetical protein